MHACFWIDGFSLAITFCNSGSYPNNAFIRHLPMRSCYNYAYNYNKPFGCSGLYCQFLWNSTQTFFLSRMSLALLLYWYCKNCLLMFANDSKSFWSIRNICIYAYIYVCIMSVIIIITQLSIISLFGTPFFLSYTTYIFKSRRVKIVECGNSWELRCRRMRQPF